MDGGQQVKLTPQVRSSVAVTPYSSLTLTVDADLTANPTLMPAINSRVLSAGAEQKLFSDALSLRGGVIKNEDTWT